MFILRWAGILFSCHLALSSASIEARSVQQSNGEVYRGSDNDVPVPLRQQQAAANPGAHPTILSSSSRLSTEIIVRRYIVSDNQPVGRHRVAESDRVLISKDPNDYLIVARRAVSATPSTSPCPTPSAPTLKSAAPCTNLFVQCSTSNSAPASTKGRDIAIVVAVFLLLCLVGTVFLVRYVRGKNANAGDAETTSKPSGDLTVTPYLEPPSDDTSLPTYYPAQGNLGHVNSPNLLRVASGGRTKLISVQSSGVTPPPATRTPVPTVESDRQLSRPNAGQGHVDQQQRELDNRLRVVQQEMMTLQANLSSTRSRRIDHITRSTGNTGDDTEADITVREVRELVRELEDQIASLQAHHGSALASHQIVEPPPGYQPSPPTQASGRPGTQNTN